ncbi:transposase [Ethanoligenens sp.]|uniref:transposase n=1 Tax=Ethanoligenens sp. TaxID=2099655 RepID=UPI0039E818F4
MEREQTGRRVPAAEGAARLLQVALQAVMQGELDTALGYDRSQRRFGETGEKNFRNGYSARTLRTTFGPVPLAVPRDRGGVYTPHILNRYARDARGLEEKLLFLFAQDADTETFMEQVRALYDTPQAEEELRHIAAHLLPAVRAWQMRRLESEYPFIALETVREQSIRGRTAQLLLGELPGGRREVLGIRMNAKPSYRFWIEALADLRARGATQPPLFCVGGGAGFRQAVRTLFPAAQLRRSFAPALGAPEAVAAKA